MSSSNSIRAGPHAHQGVAIGDHQREGREGRVRQPGIRFEVDGSADAAEQTDVVAERLGALGGHRRGSQGQEQEEGKSSGQRGLLDRFEAATRQDRGAGRQYSATLSRLCGSYGRHERSTHDAPIRPPRWISGALDFLLPDRCLGCARPRAPRRAACGLCLPCFALLRRPPRPVLLALWPPAARGRRADPPLLRVLPTRIHRPSSSYTPSGSIARRSIASCGRSSSTGSTTSAASWPRPPPRPSERSSGSSPWSLRCPCTGAVDGCADSTRPNGSPQPLARRLATPFAQPLSRPAATRAQARLPRRERLAGPRRAFRVSDPASVAGRRILLVDDVTTTGATLRAAAGALRAAGAGPITVFAIALTPPPAPLPGPARGPAADPPAGGPAAAPGNALRPLAR